MTPGNTTVTEFQDVSLGAVVEGNPAPYVAWVSQNGSVLQNKTEGFNYTVTRITRNGGGKYQCIASNYLRSDKREFEINVLCKCAIILFQGAFIRFHTNHNIHCTAPVKTVSMMYIELLTGGMFYEPKKGRGES